MVTRSYEFELDQLDYESEGRPPNGRRVLAEYVAEWLPGDEEIPPHVSMYEQVLLKHVSADALAHPHDFRFEILEQNGLADPVSFGVLAIYEKVAA